MINYLSDGRMDNRISTEGTTSLVYNTNKQISSISSPGNISRSFTYDTKGRISTITDVIPGSAPFTTSFRYDVKGRDSTVTHPSGIVEKNTFNSNGYLSSISAGGITRWTITGMNEFQQVTRGTYGSDLSTTNIYSYGYLTSVQTGSIRLNAYTFNTATGDLEMRNNPLHMPGAIEYFHYDDLDRLDDVYFGTTTLQDIAYDATKGGITTKSDIGTLNYSLTAKPYALSSITPSTGIITPAMNDSITYTSFESVKSINEGTYNASFLYGYYNQRKKMVVQNGSNHVVTRWYPTNRFMKDSVAGTVKKYTYIGGDAYTAPVVAVITNNGSPVYYYLLRDHLGSITHVVNTSNTVVAEYSYDAWGRMRDPITWVKYAPGAEPALMIADRGFTGHEHLPWFKLINMNGRLYDPLTGQFLSADKYVQNPGFTQNFNRYVYCYNNPLRYTDLSGNVAQKPDEPDYISDFRVPGYCLYPILTTGVNYALNVSFLGTHTKITSTDDDGRTTTRWVNNNEITNVYSNGQWSETGLQVAMRYDNFAQIVDIVDYSSSGNTTRLIVQMKDEWFASITGPRNAIAYYVNSNNSSMNYLGYWSNSQENIDSPFIPSPFPYCQSSSSLRNLNYWRQYILESADRAIENNGEAPRGFRIIADGIITPVSIISKTHNMITGNDFYTGDSLNTFQQWVAPPVGLFFDSGRFPEGSGTIWDIGVELNTSKTDE